MSSWVRFKAYVNRNIIMIVAIPGIAGLHWTWAKIQEDERLVAKHERREFPPITLLKYARYMVGYGPMPDKPHPQPPS